MRHLFLALALPAALAAQHPHGEQLGRIDFPTSSGPEAQKHFIRGMLFLHSFEYDSAASAFREAQRVEPGFVLAYWGEAMTYTHPVWNQQDTAAARAALRRIAPTTSARLARAPTERERDWLNIAEVWYGEGPKARRDTLVAASLQELAAKYPADHEPRVFLALALLGLNQSVRDVPSYMRAAALMEDVFRENPEHPGAAHFLIHAYDDPVHAPLGLRAARAYSKIAPGAAHAQHMTTHIFLAMGMWDDVVAQNAVASGHDHSRWAPGHYTYWYGYGLLQQGRYRDALAHLESVRSNLGTPGPRHANLAMMRADYLVNTERWDSPMARWDIVVPPMARDIRAANAFVAGYVAIRSGRRGAADSALASLSAVAREAERAPAPSGNTLANQSPVVMELELRALLRLADGARTEAIELMRQAITLQDRMPVEFGPPIIVKPSHELLGDMLLELGRAAEASVEYEHALRLAPRRARSLLGLARAADAAGDGAVARAAWKTLGEIWHSADADLPALAEMRRAVAAR